MPIHESRTRKSSIKRQIRHHGRAWQPSPTQRNRRLISTMMTEAIRIASQAVFLCGRTRRSAPTRRICHTRPIQIVRETPKPKAMIPSPAQPHPQTASTAVGSCCHPQWQRSPCGMCLRLGCEACPQRFWRCILDRSRRRRSPTRRG